MKKDRNCMGNYPIYPNMMYGGMQMPNYGGMPMVGPMPQNITSTNNVESQINSLTSQINNLEQRVNNLENMINKNMYSNNYNTSNYQMM